MNAAKQRAFQAAADKAIAWSAAEHQKREAELAETFRKQGLDVYAPNVNAFREYAQKIYLASDDAKSWPPGMLDKINALNSKSTGPLRYARALAWPGARGRPTSLHRSGEDRRSP
jgi:TRAP-type C4-dicarboxylate transport system substrate-binding protein